MSKIFPWVSKNVMNFYIIESHTCKDWEFAQSSKSQKIYCILHAAVFTICYRIKHRNEKQSLMKFQEHLCIYYQHFGTFHTL
jgi:hypothetical protein